MDALIRGFRDKARDDPRRQTKQQKELQDRQNKKADERNEINESIQEEKKRQRQTNKKQGRPQGSEGREHKGEGGPHFVEEPIRVTVLDEREIREGCQGNEQENPLERIQEKIELDGFGGDDVGHEQQRVMEEGKQEGIEEIPFPILLDPEKEILFEKQAFVE